QPVLAIVDARFRAARDGTSETITVRVVRVLLHRDAVLLDPGKLADGVVRVRIGVGRTAERFRLGDDPPYGVARVLHAELRGSIRGSTVGAQLGEAVVGAGVGHHTERRAREQPVLRIAGEAEATGLGQE